MRTIHTLAALALGALAATAQAATIPYQGLATDASNVPVPDKVHDFGFALYSDSTGTKELWTETQSVATRKGLFAVQLGAKTPIPEKVLRSPDPFLAVNLGEGEIKPRLRLGRVPRAIHAIAADTASFAEKAAGIDAILARLSALEDRRAKDSSRIALLEGLLQGVRRQGREIVFDSLNVSVRNGLGRTDLANGLGNLVVGYNRVRGDSTDDRRGSHMVVTGDRNSYSGFGGFLGGNRNSTSGIYSTVLGGTGNVSSGQTTVVVGGLENQASAQQTAILGGFRNTAAGGIRSTVSGGSNNSVSGDMASVLGGSQNDASGPNSTVAGGASNGATGDGASVSGGALNAANGKRATVGGGIGNVVNTENGFAP